jgi:hypothetical protein
MPLEPTMVCCPHDKLTIVVITNDDWFNLTVSVPPTSENGEYSLRFYCQDNFGIPNVLYMDTTALANAGFPSTIYFDTNADYSPPSVTSVYFDKTVVNQTELPITVRY